MAAQWPTGVDWTLISGISLCTCVGVAWRDYGFDPALLPRIVSVVVGLAFLLFVRLGYAVWWRHSRAK